ncbi:MULTISPECIES: ABC transporter ATP-binding protein [Halolamina]|nr:ABC transporter ATP-binding protein [Halolamina sp. R1-12]
MMLLEIEDLRTTYTDSSTESTVTAVDGVSFEIEEGESFGLVGESGCGKSTIAKSVMRILPDNGRITDGAVRLNGEDLTELDAEPMRQRRWTDIALISQSAMNALDPVYTVDTQIKEAIEAHESWSEQRMDDRVVELFELVGIDPERRHDYPHQFSGGMKQRAMIAMALVLDPDLIIADEPTTALDVISQDTILHHLEELQAETGASMLLITHDMSVVAEMCDRTAVMYAGELAERGPTETIFTNPYHPYTLGLKNAFPSIHGGADSLISIPGAPPPLTDPADACRFADRCPFAAPECRSSDPPMKEVADEHEAACARIDDVGIETMREQAAKREVWHGVDDAPDGASAGDGAASAPTEVSGGDSA